MTSPYILFENRRLIGTPYAGLLFSEPCDEVVCWHAAQLDERLARVDELRRQGYYLAGYLSYEAGYALRGLAAEPYRKEKHAFPLLHFFAFKSPQKLTMEDINQQLDDADVLIDSIKLNISAAAYGRAFNQIKKHINRGDTYQVNLTAKYKFNFEGPVHGLYKQLRERQRVAYSALMRMPGYDILSLSPELFFSKMNTTLRAKPMKGTMPRAVDAVDDAANYNFLKTDPKSMAENTMIVDLLRNDIAAISKPGSVHVSRLLEVESFETVHQMTSCIQSEVERELPFATIMQHVFPCGSITGAPKRRTMEIIRDLESEPRHIYTGAIGYITPENNMCFNVPIRTLLLRDSKGELGVGGGIVHDSTEQAEFEEMKLKARFFTS
ncbi:MAG: aminodeoxychorismate synthase component I [Legionellaceae bacterium]|nr:aminodeoxychorismate synthase component I [Legionellaceae bacterium]